MADKDISQTNNVLVTGMDEKHPDREHHAGLQDSDSLSFQVGSTDQDHIFATSDPVLDAKMHLLNRV